MLNALYLETVNAVSSQAYLLIDKSNLLKGVQQTA